MVTMVTVFLGLTVTVTKVMVTVTKVVVTTWKPLFFPVSLLFSVIYYTNGKKFAGNELWTS